ncbi:unnamed protein product [Brachionus calyciflorus]|uniref:Choline O-acetyltransferase n=1 Tax=Brachionus calyciflorus TaxID=104777 RepID=A0A813N235_9BILA|nr:unnamed protein product [Brachionus calyciflorus]
MSSINRSSILKKFASSSIRSRHGIKWIASPYNYMAQNVIPNQIDHSKNRFLLPKLSVPRLESTVTSYLRSLEPILPQSNFKKAQESAREFLNSKNTLNGYNLQKILNNLSERKENWASEIYANEYYYKVKLPLPIYSNPAKLMKKQYFEDENAFLKYVTILINAVLDFKFKIDSNTLEVDKPTGCDKSANLCMDQYKKIFSSYRQPGLDKDTFLVFKNDYSNQHIIIMSKNKLYKIDLIVNSQLINELDLFNQLRQIRQDSKRPQNEDIDIGLLTSLPRDEWSMVRNNLIKDPVNKFSLDMIEKSAFIICLDDKVDSNKYTSEDIKNGNQILNGCGTLFNSANRWFDKTLQFVVSEDGISGLLREHSPSEGPITVNLIDHVYEYLKNSKSIDMHESFPYSNPSKLEWNSNSYIQNKIEHARNKFDELIDDFELNVFKYDKFGRSFPKQLKISPDSFLQIALQYAYFKVNQELPVHVSMGSLRRFHKGRVDYIRGPSKDLLKFCQSMQKSHVTNQEKLFLLKKAVNVQTKTMLDTILGNGYDCHLAALKNIAEEKYGKLPALFTDESFEINNKLKLLASQVTTNFDGTFSCFGPNVIGGHTSTYNYKPNEILFTVAGYKSTSINSVSCLSDAFKLSLDEIFFLVKN